MTALMMPMIVCGRSSLLPLQPAAALTSSGMLESSHLGLLLVVCPLLPVVGWSFGGSSVCGCGPAKAVEVTVNSDITKMKPDNKVFLANEC